MPRHPVSALRSRPTRCIRVRLALRLSRLIVNELYMYIREIFALTDSVCTLHEWTMTRKTNSAQPVARSRPAARY